MKKHNSLLVALLCLVFISPVHSQSVKEIEELFQTAFYYNSEVFPPFRNSYDGFRFYHMADSAITGEVATGYIYRCNIERYYSKFTRTGVINDYLFRDWRYVIRELKIENFSEESRNLIVRILRYWEYDTERPVFVMKTYNENDLFMRQTYLLQINTKGNLNIVNMHGAEDYLINLKNY